MQLGLSGLNSPPLLHVITELRSHGILLSSALSIPADSLSLPTGASIKDGSNNDAVLDHEAHTRAYAVDGIGPSVTGIGVVSIPAGTAYGPGEIIRVALTFDEVVHVAGVPRVAGRVGREDRDHSYRSGTGNTTLQFSYTLTSGDSGAFIVPAGDISLPSGASIRDSVRNDTDPAHGATAARQGQDADGTAPVLQSITIVSTPADPDGYRLGETIRLRARFDEDVTASASSTLAIVVSITRESLPLQSAAGTDVFFTYTVMPADLDSDGISVPEDPFGLSTVIEDAVGNAADLDHVGLPDQVGHLVDGIRPRVRGGGIRFDREEIARIKYLLLGPAGVFVSELGLHVQLREAAGWGHVPVQGGPEERVPLGVMGDKEVPARRLGITGWPDPQARPLAGTP